MSTFIYKAKTNLGQQGRSRKTPGTTNEKWLICNLDLYTGHPYILPMHTVVETPSFLSAAKDAGMSDDERRAVVDVLARNPDQGVMLKETGGFRKLRIAAEGRGKSSSYRVITFFSGPEIPVFLITVFAKSEADNLSKAERNGLARMAKSLIETYAQRGRKGPKR